MKKLVIPFFLLIVIASCNKTLSDKEITAYKEKGSFIANNTAEALSETLSSKMKSEGLKEAVEFCNTAAIPLTRQIADTYEVDIKRTALKTRNSLNSPSSQEMLILNTYQESLDQGDSLQPIVKLEKGIPNFYAPIFVKKKCLVCHGSPNKELSRVADSIIKSYYPNDMAIGFKEGDLRGMWRISFLNQPTPN